MPDFHDPLVQFIINAAIAIIVGIAAVLVAVWVYQRQKSKKELSYRLVSSAPVVSIQPGMADKIQIYLNGSEIKEAQLAVLSVVNTGTVAVKRDDYDEPITIEFPGCKVLNGDILRTRPENLFKPEDLKTAIAWDNQSVTIAKHLLNPKDGLRFSILVEGPYIEPTIRGRIVDGVLIKNKQKTSKYDGLTIVSSIIILIIVPIASFVPSIKNNTLINGLLTVLITTFTFLLITAPLLHFLRRKKDREREI